jgi:hypothetical protein
MANASTYTPKQLRDYSWMSQAAYLKLDGIAPAIRDSLAEALTIEKTPFNPTNLFSPSQATMFTDSSKGFSLVSHQPDQTSGFSATVFKSAANGSYTLAVRGTDVENQVLEDLINADVLGVLMTGQAKSQLFDA